MNDPKPTVIFFSRMGLCHLFGGLDKFLNKKYKIIHIAYSSIDANILKKNYNIIPDYILVEYIQNLKLDMLNKLEVLEKINILFQEDMTNRFTLNSVIISDRTLESFSLDEAYDIVIKHYLFWEKIFNEFSDINILFHETTTHTYNHIASALAKHKKIIYSGFIACTGIYKNNFRFTEYDDGDSLLLQYYMRLNTKYYKNSEEVQNFIDKTRAKNAVLIKTKTNSFFFDLYQIVKGIIRKCWNIYQRFNCNRLIDPNEYYILKQNEVLHSAFNRILYKFNLTYNKVDFSEEYYYFALHIEPEAVLSHWSFGKYSQIALIEQLARRLPIGKYLYVKDHKLDIGYRNLCDYKKIQRLFNVKLIDPSHDSLELIKNSIGVIILNGTVGLEASIYKRPVYMFGNSYLKHNKNIILIKNIDDFTEIIQDKFQFKEEILKNFIQYYLDSNFEGDIYKFFVAYKYCDYDETNLAKLADSFTKYIDILSFIKNEN
ncbi:hypothetical protein [Sulfurospirillum sp. UCH001]|uniref:capsular polysaccharide export protein, LipB/KpsS family n=1 Tax=Sulfurospirillum sp. UCH001 TaxID=1581011 RepID=UPI0008297CAD|nr:hypothetical protein [Sulfurospirillum sp. UCH001]